MQNARRAHKIRLCGHLRRYKKIVKKTYIIYTNYLLPVRHGETVKIISLYEHYALVKSHGIMGWIPRSILKQ